MADSQKTEKTVTVTDNSTGKSVTLPVSSGSIGPDVLDIRKLYAETGRFTFDPGYGATSRMLAQAGLCLARDELSVGGGIWTTASAMGDSLLARLPQVDIHFSVVED